MRRCSRASGAGKRMDVRFQRSSRSMTKLGRFHKRGGKRVQARRMAVQRRIDEGAQRTTRGEASDLKEVIADGAGDLKEDIAAVHADGAGDRMVGDPILDVTAAGNDGMVPAVTPLGDAVVDSRFRDSASASESE